MATASTAERPAAFPTMSPTAPKSEPYLDVWDDVMIARGAFACILEGDMNGTPVAVKQMNRRDVTTAVEVAVATKIRHPYTTRAYPATMSADCVLMPMDLYRDGDLLDKLTSSGPLPGATARRVLAQVSSAVSHLHTCGVAHRDIKPDNVLLHTDAETGDVSACLTDFGSALVASNGASQTDVVAEDMDSSLCLGCLHRRHAASAARAAAASVSGQRVTWAKPAVPAVAGCTTPTRHAGNDRFATFSAMGTEAYMAPEVLARIDRQPRDMRANGDDYGYDAQAADVWSLGVLAYTLAAGNVPWQHASELDKWYAWYARGKKRRPEYVSEGAYKFFLRCCAINPADRPCAREVLGDPYIAEFVAALPPEATDPALATAGDAVVSSDDFADAVLRDVAMANFGLPSAPVPACVHTCMFEHVEARQLAAASGAREATLAAASPSTPTATDDSGPAHMFPDSPVAMSSRTVTKRRRSSNDDPDGFFGEIEDLEPATPDGVAGDMQQLSMVSDDDGGASSGCDDDGARDDDADLEPAPTTPQAGEWMPHPLASLPLPPASSPKPIPGVGLGACGSGSGSGSGGGSSSSSGAVGIGGLVPFPTASAPWERAGTPTHDMGAARVSSDDASVASSPGCSPPADSFIVVKHPQSPKRLRFRADA